MPRYDMAFGVYIHFPYCLSKCSYCDFASRAVREPPHRRYAQAIAREAELRAASVRGREAISIYIGGGTPSLWEPASLGRALDAVKASVALLPGAEQTLEANPGASDASRFTAFRRLGLNRISIGIQSFDRAVLERLGRIHTVEEAEAAFHFAREAGFENVALDLIYGAPGQDSAMARSDAARAVSLGPEHLSCYALTLEELAIEVPMAREVRSGKLHVPDSDAQWQMGREVSAELTKAGYARYEISNFALPGREARHNMLYWTGGEYLGLGCGACGFLLQDPGDPSRGGRRWGNHRSPERYLEDVEAGRRPEAWSEELDAEMLLHERIAMGLRTVAGLDLLEACKRLKRDPAKLLEVARELAASGLATVEDGRVSLTEKGMDFHTEVAARFFCR
jgi:oxygen-independent coproporphyrinogen-3 oxidase